VAAPLQVKIWNLHEGAGLSFFLSCVQSPPCVPCLVAANFVPSWLDASFFSVCVFVCALLRPVAMPRGPKGISKQKAKRRRVEPELMTCPQMCEAVRDALQADPLKLFTVSTMLSDHQGRAYRLSRAPQQLLIPIYHAVVVGAPGDGGAPPGDGDGDDLMRDGAPDDPPTDVKVAKDVPHAADDHPDIDMTLADEDNTAELLVSPSTRKRKRPANLQVASNRSQRRVANEVLSAVDDAVRSVLEKYGLTMGTDFRFIEGGFEVLLGPPEGKRRWWTLTHADQVVKQGDVEQGCDDDDDAEDCSADPAEYCDDDKEREQGENTLLKSLVALKDKLFLSNGQYQSLSNELHRLYGLRLLSLHNIAQEKRQQNEENELRFRVTRAMTPGWECGLEELLGVRLSEALMREAATCNKLNLALDGTFECLLSGDGANMTREVGQVAVTLKLLDLGAAANLQRNIHTVVLLTGKESYPLLRLGLRKLFASAANIVSGRSHVHLDVCSPHLLELGLPLGPARTVAEYVGQTAKCVFKFCADMKFTHLALGFNGAHADYSCYQCELPKKHFACITKHHQACTLHRNVQPASLCAATRSLPSTAPSSSSSSLCDDSKEAEPLRCCEGTRKLPESDPELERLSAQARRVLEYLSYEKELLDFKLPNLQRKCTEQKLATKGTKAVLVARLLAKLQPLDDDDRIVLADVQQLVENGKGFIAPSILRGIEMQNIIVDLLHMKLRIGGKLLKLLLVGDVLKEERQDDVVAAMRKIGVTFKFRAAASSKDGDGKVAWTSLMGTQTSRVLTKFDVTAVVPGPRGVKLQKLWTDFWTHFCAILDWNKETGDCNLLQEKLTAWLEDFLSFYGVNDITPYIHHFTTHCAEYVQRHGALRRYVCEAAELLNNVHQKIYHRATAKGGGRSTTLSKLKDPEYQILMRDQRWRDWLDENSEPTFRCPLCKNKEFKFFGWLFRHLDKEHTPAEVAAFDESVLKAKI